MTEMTPQEAALVWTRVPEVEQELTPRVVGLANILTGLAIGAAGLPLYSLLSIDEPWATPAAMLVWGALIALFLGLRAGLWRVYGLAKPEGRTLLYRYRTPGSWKWLAVDWWFLAAFGWFMVATLMTTWPDPVRRSADVVALFLTVYTFAGGVWESRQSWCRRPYLLVSCMVLGAVGWGLHIATDLHYGLVGLLGLVWVLAGTALYNQV